MKNIHDEKIAPYLFPLGFSCFGGLLTNCLLHLLGFLSPFGMYGHTLRLAGICLLLAAVAIAVLAVLILVNYNFLPDGNQARLVLIIEVIESALLFLPALWLWSIPLDFIADYFLK